MRTYQLDDFMKYPNFAFQLGMLPPFSWSGSKTHPNVSIYVKVLTRIWFVFGAVNLIYQNFGMLVYLFASSGNGVFVYGKDNVSFMAQISETGGIMGLSIVATCKLCVLFWHRKKITALLEEFQQMFPNDYVQENAPNTYRVHYYAEKSRLLMKRTTNFFLWAFCYYNTLPIVQICYECLTVDDPYYFYFQSNTWYPWQNKNSSWPALTYLATYICQVQSSMAGVCYILAGEFMLCFFITQMQLHFDYLSNMLQRLDARNDTIAIEQLRTLVRYHNKLLQFTSEINNIFDGSFLANFITSSVAICLMGFSMVMISPLHAFKYSVGLLTFLIFTFFICHIGNEFTEASKKIAPAALYSNWYDGNMRYRKILMVLMLGGNKPCVLRAYKFTTVSMHTFMLILKTSYQLFTFIRAMG